MGIIENPKTYTGRDLETIFFRPMLKGDNAEALGIRVLYNMPVPTTIQMWSPKSDILRNYAPGWTGGDASERKQKSINLAKIKAELGFSATEYFNQVYELIVGRADVNLDDLTGSELEQAETEMFRAAIAESLRATMWVGNVENEQFNNFNGFLTLIRNYASECEIPTAEFTSSDAMENITEVFRKMWALAPARLRSLKSEGNLVFFVTSDICDAYEQYLDSCGADAAYTDLTTGRRELSYHGIKVVDMGISHYLAEGLLDSTSYCILTDRRNLALAVNTADYPGSEIRMWYNPDMMENRQRAVFMAGCEILDEELMVVAHFS